MGCCGCSESLGNIRDQDFGFLWKGHAYGTYRQQALNLTRHGQPPKGCD